MLESNRIVGWDIGGAHIKLAYCNANQLLVDQISCPLWKGIDELTTMLPTLSAHLPAHIDTHHITMTGELVDCFDDRQQGVRAIITALQNHLTGTIKVFSLHGLISPQQAYDQPHDVASMNWLASVKALAKKYKNATFIDMGSTTTDILQIRNHKLCSDAISDFDRLRTGELVYTGVVRSCVNTVADSVLFQSQQIPLIAENFAVTADIYRILKRLPPHADLGDTMDGKEKNQYASLVRLARMCGLDYSEDDYTDWYAVAESLMHKQKQKIKQQLQTHTQDGQKLVLVAAGVGRFVIEDIAKEMDIQSHSFCQALMTTDLQPTANADDCAPAVALLFQDH